MSRYSKDATVDWKAQRKRVLDRDDWVCAYCGKDLVGSDATVDHVVAVKHLGHEYDYNDDELVSACRSCNSSKQDRTIVRRFYLNPKWLNL